MWPDPQETEEILNRKLNGGFLIIYIFLPDSLTLRRTETILKKLSSVRPQFNKQLNKTPFSQWKGCIHNERGADKKVFFPSSSVLQEKQKTQDKAFTEVKHKISGGIQESYEKQSWS